MAPKEKTPQEQLVEWLKSAVVDREMQTILIAGAKKIPDAEAIKMLKNIQNATTGLLEFLRELNKARNLEDIKSGAKQHEHADLAELRNCCMVYGELDFDLVTAHFEYLQNHKYHNGQSECDNPCGPCKCGSWHSCDSPKFPCSSCGRIGMIV